MDKINTLIHADMGEQAGIYMDNPEIPYGFMSGGMGQPYFPRYSEAQRRIRHSANYGEDSVLPPRQYRNRFPAPYGLYGRLGQENDKGMGTTTKLIIAGAGILVAFFLYKKFKK